MKWAWCSPLPPAGSGIADYNAELLSALQPAVRGDGGDVEVLDNADSDALAALPARLERGDFDLAVYHLGNHPGYHAAILRAAMVPVNRQRGVAVLHEPMLHHLLREPLLGGGKDVAYLDLMEQVYGQIGRHVAERFLQADGLPEMWAFGLFEPVVDVCRGVVVFNEPARQRVLASRPAAAVEVVPQHVVIEPELLDGSADPAALRSSLGLPTGNHLPAEAFVFGCFGHLTLQKRLPAIVRTFASLLSEMPHDGPPLRLLLAGQLAANVTAESLLEEVSVAHREAVRAAMVVTGRLPMDAFQRAMAACDVALNLRFPSGGETSATLLRLLALGKPTLVTDVGSFASLPPDVALRIPPDDSEEALLLACMRRLATDPQLRCDLGNSARRFAVTEHSMDASIRSWTRALTRIADARPAPVVSASGTAQASLHLDLGARLDELGLGDDEDLLRAVARATVELALDPAFSPKLRGRTQALAAGVRHGH